MVPNSLQATWAIVENQTRDSMLAHAFLAKRSPPMPRMRQNRHLEASQGPSPLALQVVRLVRGRARAPGLVPPMPQNAGVDAAPGSP